MADAVGRQQHGIAVVLFRRHGARHEDAADAAPRVGAAQARVGHGAGGTAADVAEVHGRPEQRGRKVAPFHPQRLAHGERGFDAFAADQMRGRGGVAVQVDVPTLLRAPHFLGDEDLARHRIDDLGLALAGGEIEPGAVAAAEAVRAVIDAGQQRRGLADDTPSAIHMVPVVEAGMKAQTGSRRCGDATSPQVLFSRGAAERDTLGPDRAGPVHLALAVGIGLAGAAVGLRLGIALALLHQVRIGPPHIIAGGTARHGLAGDLLAGAEETGPRDVLHQGDDVATRAGRAPAKEHALAGVDRETVLAATGGAGPHAPAAAAFHGMVAGNPVQHLPQVGAAGALDPGLGVGIAGAHHSRLPCGAVCVAAREGAAAGGGGTSAACGPACPPPAEAAAGRSVKPMRARWARQAHSVAPRKVKPKTASPVQPVCTQL